jgi:hypothetical protein
MEVPMKIPKKDVAKIKENVKKLARLQYGKATKAAQKRVIEDVLKK